MAVISKQLEKELAVQTDLMDEPEKLRVITKLIHPLARWEWYLICFDCQEKKTIYSILEGFETEYGIIGLEEINTHKPEGMPFEIDKTFKPCNAKELFESLKKTRD